MTSASPVGPDSPPTPSQTPSQTPSPTQADLVARAACGVPGVAGLHAGAFGAVATHLPGRQVAGVRLGADRAEVHLVVTMGARILEVADAVVAAVGPLVDTPVAVVVEDVVPVTPDALPAAPQD